MINVYIINKRIMEIKIIKIIKIIEIKIIKIKIKKKVSFIKYIFTIEIKIWS